MNDDQADREKRITSIERELIEVVAEAKELRRSLIRLRAEARAPHEVVLEVADVTGK